MYSIHVLIDKILDKNSFGDIFKVITIMPESDVLKWANIPQMCNLSLPCDEADGQVPQDSMKSHPYQLLIDKYHVNLPALQ